MTDPVNVRCPACASSPGDPCRNRYAKAKPTCAARTNAAATAGARPSAPAPKAGAIVSECGAYRYHLWRVWDECLPCMCWVMQNPSTADATEDDPTIRRCIGFAEREGYGGISVRNVFALRATDERELLTHRDPFGPENEAHLLAARQVSMMTRLVVAWGERLGGKRLRHHYVRAAVLLSPLSPYCLGTNASGEPKHPLYLPAGAAMAPWKMPDGNAPAPSPDDFTAATPPPRTRPIGEPVPAYYVLPPGEAVRALFAEWERAGRLPAGAVLCDWRPGLRGPADATRVAVTVVARQYGSPKWVVLVPQLKGETA